MLVPQSERLAKIDPPKAAARGAIRLKAARPVQIARAFLQRVLPTPLGAGPHVTAAQIQRPQRRVQPVIAISQHH